MAVEVGEGEAVACDVGVGVGLGVAVGLLVGVGVGIGWLRLTCVLWVTISSSWAWLLTTCKSIWEMLMSATVGDDKVVWKRSSAILKTPLGALSLSSGLTATTKTSSPLVLAWVSDVLVMTCLKKELMVTS